LPRVTDTRDRILDLAESAVLAKGFDATSIDEIVAAAAITKGGFFYHFPDKTALARALIERYIAREEALFDDLSSRAAELSDDPLHRFLIGLRLMAELLDDLPGGHPGCLIATAAYQDRLFDDGVRALSRHATLAWRERFLTYLQAIAARYPPHQPVDLQALADMVSGVVEGGIILAKVLREPQALAAQVLAFRALVQALFAPPALRGDGHPA
jgi:AcrR family transcriptional regulator